MYCLYGLKDIKFDGFTLYKKKHKALILQIKNFLIIYFFVMFIVVFSKDVAASSNLKFNFEGNQIISDQELLQALSPFSKGSVSTDKLQSIEALLYNFYTSKGLIATVKIPEQPFSDNTILINIYESQLDNVVVDVFDGLRFSESRIVSMVTRQLAHEPILSIDALESAAKVIDGVAGSNAKITLKKGVRDGYPDTVVTLKPSSFFNMRAQIDNYGTESVGTTRYSLFTEFSSLFYLGETLSLSAVNTDGSDLLSFDVSVPFFNNGTKLIAGARYSDYEITDFDVPLGIFEGFRGNSDTEFVGYAFPEMNWDGAFFRTTLSAGKIEAQDFIDFTGEDSLIAGNKSIDFMSLNQDVVFESQQNNMVLNGSVLLTVGDVEYQTATNQMNDALTTQSSGRFTKLNIDANLQYGFDSKTILSVFTSAQLSNKNLDRLQEMVATGPTALRAYTSGLLSADEGLLIKADLNQVITDKYTFFVFLDAAWLQTHDNVWTGWNSPNFEPNQYSLLGGGVGMNANVTPWLTLNLQYANKLKNCEACTFDTDNNQVWAVLTGTL